MSNEVVIMVSLENPYQFHQLSSYRHRYLLEHRNLRVVPTFAKFAFFKIRENMYSMKITSTNQFRGNTMKNANLNPCEMVNFR